jgi:hypothetical protein
MIEFHALRASLGLMQLAIVATLIHRDIGYLLRFGALMFASAAMNLVPAHPEDESWKYFLQMPAYLVILAITIDATLEMFAFLRRRTFIEERLALLSFAGIVGLIPVWICWTWPGDNWYQSAMLLRQYFLMWVASGFLAAWCWLRGARPIHMSQHIEDHGELWALWLMASAVLASTTKYGVLWKFAQWQGGSALWRIATDVALVAQAGICGGFLFNLRSWKADDVAAPAALPDLLSPASPRLPRPLNP